MTRNATILLILIIAGILLTTGCHKFPKIEGNGQVVKESRMLVSFDKVENEGTFNVFIRQDTAFTATVEAESNLIPYIRTRINGNTLVIDTRENLSSNYPINVFVTTPIISGAYLSGSGSITLDSLKTDYLELSISGSGWLKGDAYTNNLVNRISGSGYIDLEAHTGTCDTRISGSGDIDLLGTAASSNFSISGSGNIRSNSFTQKECIAKISGSGSMYVNVTDYLDVTISGSGSVYYLGNPQLNVTITGSGKVIRQ